MLTEDLKDSENLPVFSSLFGGSAFKNKIFLIIISTFCKSCFLILMIYKNINLRLLAI